MHAIVTRKLFFSPSSDPLLSNRGGRARKTKSSFFVLSPRTILLSDEKSEETGIPLAHFGNSPRSSTSNSRFKTRTRRFFFFFNPEIKFFRSNSRSAMIDQRHRKIHRGPSTPPPRRIPATPRRKQNNRATSRPQFDRSASWSVESRDNICPGAKSLPRREGSVILIAASLSSNGV